MCGRFGLEFDDDFYPRFNIGNILYDFASRYNIAPGQMVPVIRNQPMYHTVHGRNQDENIAELMRWGLVPFWAKDPKIGYKMINAKAETIAEKPSFRSAFKRNRVLIPATNFYEWKKTSDKKIPYFIGLKNQKYFSFAGLAESWTDPAGKVLNTFTIITKPANKVIGKIHDRMPVILDPDEEGEWLKGGDESFLKKILMSGNEGNFDIYQISDEVNSPGNDNKQLIRKV
jgi:putative SOS response-associated peptidase YedK